MDKYRDFILEQIDDLRLEKDADFILFVEDKEDQIFWETVLKHQDFQLKPKINPYGVSKNDKVTTGKDIILKYQPFCSEFPNKVKIAIDSDYDYLLDRGNYNIQNHIFQTYTYSIENYFCYAPSLEYLCLEETQSKNITGFDFEKFLSEYSKIIYPLYILSLLYEQNKKQFDKDSFYSIANFCEDVFVDFQMVEMEAIISHLSILKEKVDSQVNSLKENFSSDDYELMNTKVEAKGVTSENCYLFIRGHFLLERLVAPIVKNIRTKLSKEVGSKIKDHTQKQTYFSQLKTASDLLKDNLNFYSCSFYKKVEQDILEFKQAG